MSAYSRSSTPGAAGAMRPFSKRGVTQDQILKIIAYIHTLKK